MVSLERRREIARESYHRRKKPPVLSDRLCECGCGEHTQLAPRTSTEKGWIKGEPKRFVHGHNRRRYHEPPTETRCYECGRTLPAAAFYADKHRPTGLSSSCKKCRNRGGQPVRQEDSRRRRVRKLQGVVEKIDPFAIYDRDGGRCHICGKRVAKSKMTLDHLVPVSKGGDHVALNVRLAHGSCNSRRGDGRLPAQLLLH